MFQLHSSGSDDSESGIHGGEPSPFRAAGGATPHQQPGEPSAAPEPSAQESSAWPQPCPASPPIIVLNEGWTAYAAWPQPCPATWPIIVANKGWKTLLV